MAGDVLKSNQSVHDRAALLASPAPVAISPRLRSGSAVLERNGRCWQLHPGHCRPGTIAQRETLIVMEWDYLALANRDCLGWQPGTGNYRPETGVIWLDPYAGGISAYAPHPYAARLWWEFVMSDEGQNIYLKGYAHPIRFNDMAKRGVIPQEMLDKLPPAEAYEKAFFPTIARFTRNQNRYHRELA